MTTMKALKVVGPGDTQIQKVPIPKLRDDYVLVKVHSVAINPTDWKHTTIPPLAEHSKGCTVGCDYSGTVVEVGKAVTKPWKKGDRIAGFTHGCNNVEPEDGAFAEYAVVKGDAGQIKTPDSLSDEEAATVGVGVATIGQALYQSLKLPFPETTPAGFWLLVYGGSTGMGSLAIQYAKLSGCKVITTCSPKNFDMVKARGAIEAFDYRDPDVAKKIREYTNDELTHVFDTISDEGSPKIASEAISSKGGIIGYLLPTAVHDRKDVEGLHTLGYTFTGERFTFKYDGLVEYPASQEDFEFSKKFVDISSDLFAKKKLVAHPPHVGKGGLKGVLEGMNFMREGKVSGVKLVYNIADTP